MPSELVPGLDARFDAIVHRAVQANRDDRYQSAREIRRDLDVILSTPAVKAGAAKAPVALAFPQQAAAPAHKPLAHGPQSVNAGTSAGPFRPAHRRQKCGRSEKRPVVPIAIGTAAVLGIGAFFLFSNSNPEPQPVALTPEAPKSGART